MSERRKKPLRTAVTERAEEKPRPAAEAPRGRAEKTSSAAKEKILRALKKLHPME